MPHGTISPAGWIKVSAGSSQTFTIQPHAGYRIKDVRIDYVSKGPLSAYTFSNINSHHRIVAIFARDQGQSDFVSAFPRGNGWFNRGGPEGYPAPVDTDGDKDTRAIEEGDIVKIDGTTLFILNQYRGLQLIDISDSSKPSLLSTVPIYGHPVELYVRDGNAYVVVANYFHCWYSPLKEETESFQGSRISVVDVRNTKAPDIMGGIDIKGFITDTRIVGSILYVVSHTDSYNYYDDPSDAANQTVITALSVADPAQVKILQELSFPVTGGFYDKNNVHVTADKIFLSQYRSGYADRDGNWVQKDVSDITIIDIADVTGIIKKGATFSVPGVVSNRWQMDFYDGYFRAITPEQTWGNGYPSLYIYKIEDLETVTPVSKLTLQIDRPESLMSVRFDGTAAYAVTYERIDPLFTIDLTDPAQPRQRAEIQMTGWIDYIEPRVDNLVTLGHDDAEGTTALSVTLFDIANLDNPVLVERVNFGEGYGWVPTEINDIHKAFKVLDDLHLIMVPFSSWSHTNNRPISGAQLIDYYFDSAARQLTKRGLIEHSGWIERALPLNDSTVMTVSNEAFQTVDISNRDKPQINKILELARNAIDLTGLSQDSVLELSSDTRWSTYEAQSTLSVVPLSNPNTPEPLTALPLPGYYDVLFSMQNCTLLSGCRYDETKGTITVVKTVSYDGSDITLRGSLEMSGLNNYPYPWIYRDGPYYLFPAEPSQAQKISETALVFSGYEYSFKNPAIPSCTVVMKIVDASTPEDLNCASTVKIDLSSGTPTRMLWVGSRAYVSYAVPIINGNDAWQSQYYKCFFKTVDCTDIHNPTISEGINIPGYVAGVSAEGKYIYTIDYQYAAFPDSSVNTVFLNILEREGNKAYVRDREIILPATTTNNNEYFALGSVVVNNEKAYYTITHGSCSADYTGSRYDTQLVTASLSDPNNIQFTSSQKLQGQGADIINVIQNKLFIYTYADSGGVLVYSLANPMEPEFESFYRTDFYPGNIVIIGDSAFVPSGMYGVKVIPLQ